jgi:hypothetical protein
VRRPLCGYYLLSRANTPIPIWTWMPARRAGQYARQATSRKKRMALAAMGAMIVVAIATAIAAGFSFVPLIIAEAFVIVGMLLLDRFVVPALERWGRGATGEEHVGRLLEELESEGWLATHDVNTGRGNIDTIVVGPGGIFTVEVKSHGGKLRSDRVEPAMLRQAYAQKKWLERVMGEPATALLVFSRAYLVGKPVSRQRGVVVIPARMLAGHLRRYPAALSTDQARRLHERLERTLDRPTSAA